MRGRAGILSLSLAAFAGGAGCQLLADLEVKELSVGAGAPDSGGADPDGSPDLDVDGGSDGGGPTPIAPKPGCTEGRPGATTDCGGKRDCCEARSVAAGTFYIRTGTIDDDGPDDVSRPAQLSAFTMDVFEVTVGRFRAFVEAGGGVKAGAPAIAAGAHPSNPQSGWRESFDTYLARDRDELEDQLAVSRFATWSPKPEGREQYPIAGVSWYQAMAFCAWDGGRLPTDAEWAFAAAGGAEQRKYPWGAELVSEPAAWECGTRYGTPGSFEDCTAIDLVPVGSRPNGRAKWGHEDMLGNADEWLLDIYCSPPADGLCKDCVTTGVCFQRTSRGGDVRMLEAEATRTYSRWRQANEPTSGKGFRCVRDPR